MDSSVKLTAAGGGIGAGLGMVIAPSLTVTAAAIKGGALVGVVGGPLGSAAGAVVGGAVGLTSCVVYQGVSLVSESLQRSHRGSWFSRALDSGAFKTTAMGGSIGTGLTLTVAAVKGGALAGTVGGPLGVAAGAAVGGAIGLTSYAVFEGVSFLTCAILRAAATDGSNQRDKPTQERPERKASVGYQMKQQKEAESSRNENKEDTPRKRKDDDERDRKRKDKKINNSGKASEYEARIKAILKEINELPADASESERLRLLRKLTDVLEEVFNDPKLIKVFICEESRSLVIRMDGCRDMVIPAAVREQLLTYNMQTPPCVRQDATGRSIIYRIRCKKCNRNYVGKSTDFERRIEEHATSVNPQYLLEGYNVERNPSTLCQHANQHSERTNQRFSRIYEHSTLVQLPDDVSSRTLHSWEDFFQWLLKALVGDDGIGKK